MRLRSAVVATQPTVEPVSLYDAKAQLSILAEQTDDDDLIMGKVAAACRFAEQRLGVALAVQQLRCRWEPSLDGWTRSGDGTGLPVLRLPVRPVLEGLAYPVTMDIDGVAVSSSTYSVDADCGEVRFTNAPLIAASSLLTFTYWAGPAPGSRIAPQVRSAILLMVGHLYLNREAASADRIVEVPMAVETLLASASVTGRY